MKIVQIFPGKVWGGAEQYILDLGKALSKQGHEVVYIAKDVPAVTQRLVKEVAFTTIPKNDFLNIRTIRQLKEILNDNIPDVVHIHDTRFVFPLMTAKAMSCIDCKVILTRHIARRSRTNPFLRPFYRQLHGIIFVSQLAKNYWKSVNLWMFEDKCHVVHNSIPDMETINANSIRSRYSIAESTPLLLFAGRVRKSKGCETIVRALAKVKNNFAMVFIGQCKPENYGERLMNIAKEAGIGDRVFIHGFTPTPRALMAQADIGLCPSIVREACPLSPMEFMQAGVPVISTTNGGQVEYLHNGINALLIAPDNDEQLSEAVAQLLDDALLRKKIGSSAQESFRKHLTYDKFISNMEMAYFNSPDINQ